MAPSRPALSPGSIADTQARLLLWCQRQPEGLARVEFASEFARQRVVNQLRGALSALEIPVHEIKLPLWEQPEVVVQGLLAQLETLDTGVVSVSGWATAFSDQVPLLEALRLLNFNRENLTGAGLRQIWWLSPALVDATLHAMPDLNSWFTLRLSLTEDVVVEGREQLQVPMLSTGTVMNLEDARRYAKDLAERFERAQAAGMSPSQGLESFVLPAVQALVRAGAQQEAQALANRFEVFPIGEDEPDLATSLNNLAELYYLQGQYAEAEPLFLKSQAIREQQLGPEHLDVAESLNNLAELYRAQGQYTEAEPLYLRSQGIWEKKLGPDHPDVARSLNNLAALYRAQGRYIEAEPLFLKSKDIREQQLGTDHPDVAASLNNLAALYKAQGRYDEAEPLYLSSQAIWEKQLGPNHPDVSASLNNLAELYRAQGRYAKAEPLYLKSKTIIEKQLGPDHPDVATSLNNLAGLYDSQGRYAEAEPLYLRSKTIREQQLGPNHPYVATSLNNLAGLYEAQARYSEAEPLYLRSRAIREQQLGPDHPDIATSLNNLARFYEVLGRYTEAEPMYLEGLRILSQVSEQSGFEHPNLKTIIQNFRLFLIQVIRAGYQAELSDHPTTQELLVQLQTEAD